MRVALGSIAVAGAGLAVAFVAVAGAPRLASAEAPSAVDGPALVAKIAQRVGAAEREFPGNYSRRQIVRKMLDPKKGTVRKKEELGADVWEFHGEPQQMKVLTCRIDGERLESSECAPDLQADPMLRVFGPEGNKNYTVTYAGQTVIEGTPVYRLEVRARKKTARHFEGQLYFAVDSLLLVRVSGTLAKFPFGLKALTLELNFVDVNGLAMFAAGHSDLTIYVPLLYSERMVTEFTATDQRPLTAAQRPKD